LPASHSEGASFRFVIAQMGLTVETGEHRMFGVREMKLYVGNLSYNTSQDTLQNEFSAHGQVQEVAIINDRETGRPRGFAFVTMTNDEDAKSAIEVLNGRELDGRTITVNEARPKANRTGGGGGGRRW